MSINARIKERRIAMGFKSQSEFAKKVGVTWQTVQQWEHEGGTAPKRSRIESVAEALEVTAEWLLYGGDAQPDKKVVSGSKKTHDQVEEIPAKDGSPIAGGKVDIKEFAECSAKLIQALQYAWGNKAEVNLLMKAAGSIIRTHAVYSMKSGDHFGQ